MHTTSLQKMQPRWLWFGYLAQASARLVPAGGGAVFDLAACDTPTDTRLEVALPAEITAGDYTLVVAN